VLPSDTKGHLIALAVICTVFLSCRNSERKDKRVESGNVEGASVFANRDQENHYIAELLRFRAEKDSFLQSSPRSPIKKEDQRTFRHLRYYEIDPQFVVRAALHRNENPALLTITTTTGKTRDALIFGKLEFTLQGRKFRLSAFKFADRRSQGDIFVPFTDSTSGHESYGAGRYLDLEENETGEYVLDFNRAYNPYCAYNEEYSCPIPPRENRLSTAITAGEKIYH
jgi:uncharacterized protein (DUF1684 family)